jgi:hypothetical protein
MNQRLLEAIVADESRADRFKRLATKRTQNVLHALRVLGNCASRGQYDYSDDDVRKIFNAIDRQVSDIKAKFKGNDKLEFRL